MTAVRAVYGRARAMKSVLDDLGVESELYEDNSGHHYKYWVPNFERYLTWLSKDWQEIIKRSNQEIENILAT